MFILDADLVPVREIGLEAVYQKPRSLELAAASRTYLNRVLGRRGGEETGKWALHGEMAPSGGMIFDEIL
jgi:hypothetical protein